MPRLKMRNPFKSRKTRRRKISPPLRSMKRLVRSSERERLVLLRHLNALEREKSALEKKKELALVRHHNLNMSLKNSFERYLKSEERKKTRQTKKKKRSSRRKGTKK